MPLTTLLAPRRPCGGGGGFGPLDADLVRAIVATASGNPFTSWCLTITDPDGRALGHGCGQRRSKSSGGRGGRSSGGGGWPSGGPGPRDGTGPPPEGTLRPPRATGTPEAAHPREAPGPPGPAHSPAAARAPGDARWPGADRSPGDSGPPGDHRWPGAVLLLAPPRIPDSLSFTITPIAVGDCDHRHESSGYQLSPRLRHLIETRSTRCTFPGCRRPARRCDQDHTQPYDQGGRTCECNLGPLCRHHHRAKQTHGWRLDQREPGVMGWTVPSGRRYITLPTSHPI